MSLLVKKFGGTSVGTIERIKNVAQLAIDAQNQGHGVVLVVSAMAGETNRLVELARKINPVPYSREYDMLVSSGEQMAVGLVSLAINTLKPQSSRPLLGYQVGIYTDSIYSKARIQAIDTGLLKSELKRGVIPIIAGFQGIDRAQNITTLGRGGSDTSAVAIAIALGAQVCEIYTDVDGVYTADPRVCPEARKMDQISFEEMMELSGLGAKVLQIRSVELAAKFDMPIHVRSSFKKGEGTMVVSKKQLGKDLEKVVVAGVAHDFSQVKFSLQNVPDRPGIAAKIFGALAKAAIDVDIIVQDIPSQGKLTLSFTVLGADHLKAKRTLEIIKQKTLREMSIVEEKNLAKISIVGVGMQHHPGVAAKMFKLLARVKINIKLITTSEIKISCLIEESHAKKAVRVLHRGFGLGNKN